jgi:peptidyl-prolyl cis-trans isomerase B (cyclophilin B)
VDLQKAGVQLRGTELADVSFTWPGLQGASAMIKVAPDVSGIDLNDLDMSKTTVVLSTNFGDMTIAFYPEKAPNHVRNFLKLAQSGFYDGTKFHRVLSGFMVQGGCPNTREGATGTPGTGGPGWAVDAEFNDIKHVRGILSMARSADPNSAGSQFFVVHGVASHLDGQYTAFGVLEDGFRTLDDIAAVPVGGSQGSEPLAPVHLYFAAILPVLNSR